MAPLEIIWTIFAGLYDNTKVGRSKFARRTLGGAAMIFDSGKFKRYIGFRLKAQTYLPIIERKATI
jgi:hypothetical protein